MSTLFKTIYAYLLLPCLLVVVGSAEAWAYDIGNEKFCEVANDSWGALADISPYLTDLSAQRNFEETLRQSSQHRTGEIQEKSSSSVGDAPLDSTAGKGQNYSLPEDCSKETFPGHEDLCSDVVETPISTAPKLFTAYQAKRAANTVFESVNRFFRVVDQKIRKEGQKHSSQPELLAGLIKPEKLIGAGESDAVAIKTLISPRLAISKFFSDLPATPSTPPSGPSCRRTANNVSSCERTPFDSPHGFKLAGQSLASLPPSAPPAGFLHAFTSSKLTLRLPFPQVAALAHQQFQEVALPPPQAERTNLLLSSALFLLT